MKKSNKDLGKPTAKEFAHFAKLDPVAKRKYLAEKAKSASRKQMHEETAEMLRSMNEQAKQEIVQQSVSEEEADDAFAEALMAGPSPTQSFFWNTKNVFASLLKIPKAIIRTLMWGSAIAITMLAVMFVYVYQKAFDVFFATLLLSMISGVSYGIHYGLDGCFYIACIVIPAGLFLVGGIMLFAPPDKVGFFRKSLFLATSFGVFVLFGQLFCGGVWKVTPTTNIVAITTKQGEVKSVSYNETKGLILAPMPNIFKGDVRKVYKQQTPLEQWKRSNLAFGNSRGVLRVSAMRVTKKDNINELIYANVLKDGDMIRYSEELYEEVNQQINLLANKRDATVQDLATLKTFIEKAGNEVYGFESVVVQYEPLTRPTDDPFAVTGGDR